MAKKISVIIPNYNGRELLAKNMPQVVGNCPGCEIIIVDDASTDDSVEYVKKNLKGVKLIEQKQNRGFSHTVNTGAKASTGDLLLFINSDVSPRPGFLEPATKHFQNEKVFGVGLEDLSHEKGEIVKRGKGGANFKRGFVTHFKAPTEAGETLWVSGGSSLIDKKKFDQLGGFDEIYRPFYWEDIDLGYRAQKAGWICIFEPESKVDHFHQEGSIKKNFSPFFVKTISYRNQFLFVWLNIADYYMLTQHILFFPYHLIRSLVAFDWAFLLGFLQALSKLPSLVFRPKAQKIENKLTDKEVLKKFERQ